MIKNLFKILAFAIAYVLLFVGLGCAWEFLYQNSLVSYGSVALVAVLPNMIALCLLLIYRRLTREKWTLAEVEKWLAMPPQQRVGPIATARRKLIGRMLWIPCVAASVISLFPSETFGIATHLLRGRVTVLGKYRVRTPITWVISSTQTTYLWTIAAPGIGRIGFKRYWRHETLVSEASFAPVEHPELQLDKNVPLQGATVLSVRTFRFGKQKLSCWDLIHNNKFVGSYPTDPYIAEISCSTENDDFYAHFSGWRGDSLAFYETLQRITITE